MKNRIDTEYYLNDGNTNIDQKAEQEALLLQRNRATR